MKSTVVLLLTSFMLISCRNASKEAKAFEALLETSTGEGHTLVKFYTKVDGYRVFQNDRTGEYVAYNLKNFDRKEVTSMSAYMAAASSSDVIHNLESKIEWVVEGHYYVDSSSYTVCDSNQENCYTQTDSWTTDIWVDTSHNQTFYYGGGFKFENNSTQSHDLETMAAMNEAVAVKMISSTLSSQYALSTHRADELARLSFRYNKLENVRELTNKEKDVFALSALGVSMSDVEKSMKEKSQGNDRGYEALLEKAALKNRTTPEQIGKFFEEYMM